MKVRVGAVLVRENDILLMRRFKDERHYFTFPGGKVEEGEAWESALIREIKEELSLDAKIGRKLFELDTEVGREVFYLVTDFSGTLALGGEEKEKMNENNQYHPEWQTFEEVGNLPLIPPEAKEHVSTLKKNGAL